MKPASSLMARGAGLIFFRFSIARCAMPLFGPSLAGRSNSTTGTLAFTQWAAICAPMTPAPSTATLRIMRLLTAGSRCQMSKKVGFEREQVARAGASAANEGGGFVNESPEVKPGGGELRSV